MTEPARAMIPADHRDRTLSTGDIDLIRATIARTASEQEFSLFVAICRRTGLDPFLRQIWLIPRRHREQGANGEWRWVTTQQTMVSIDGLRLVAQRSGHYRGQRGPFWCGPDGEWRDVWLAKEPPAAAKVGVVVAGFDEPVWGVARWASYAQTDNAGKLTRFWADMPDGQLAKCAEALALRRALPYDLAGLRTDSDVPEADDPEEVAAMAAEAGRAAYAAGQTLTREQAALPESRAAWVDAMVADTNARKPEPEPAGVPHIFNQGVSVHRAEPAAAAGPIEDGVVTGESPAPAGQTVAEFRATTGRPAGDLERTAATGTTPAPATATAATVAPRSARGQNDPADPVAIEKYIAGLKEAAELGIDCEPYDVNTITVTRGELHERALKLRAAIDAKRAELAK